MKVILDKSIQCEVVKVPDEDIYLELRDNTNEHKYTGSLKLTDLIPESFRYDGCLLELDITVVAKRIPERKKPDFAKTVSERVLRD